MAMVSDRLADCTIDIVCANAGIGSFAPAAEMSKEVWTDILDVNLSGVWFTVQAVLSAMIERGAGGSIILTSSITGWGSNGQPRALRGRKIWGGRDDARMMR